MPKTAYTVDGLKRWIKATTNPGQVQAVMAKHMRIATVKNAKLLEKTQRGVIKSSRIAKNEPLTILIKHSSQPLVHTGELFQSITSVIIDDYTSFTGVLRRSAEYNIAEIIHEGIVIRVTPAMRGMFFFLWKVSDGTMDANDLTGRAAELWDAQPGGWKPLRDSTSVIKIPARPWAELAFEDANFKKQVQKNWEKALNDTFAEIARG